MTTTEYGTPGGYRDALSSGEFRALFGAFTLSMQGNVVTGLALAVLVYRQTTSALLSALTFSVALLPYLFGGTLLSGLVDRLPARRMLAGCDIGCAVLLVVMTLPGLPVLALLALLFAMSTFAPLAMGTLGALMPEILPPEAVVPGRSLIRVVAQGSQIAGYALGGGLLSVLSPRDVLTLEAGVFVVAAVVVRIFLTARPARRAPEASLAGDSLRGVAEVMRNAPLRRVLLLNWFVPFLVVAPEALAAPSVAARGWPSSAVGWWLAAVPVGLVAGELGGIWLIPAVRRARLVGAFAAAGFVPLVLFAARPSLLAALALLAVCGLGGAYSLGLDQLLLEVTDRELLGRAYTVNSAGLMALQGAGFAAAGTAAEFVSTDTVIAVAGIAGLVTVALLWRPPGGSVTPESGDGPGRSPAAT